MREFFKVFWRITESRDLEEGLSVNPLMTGEELVGHRRALAAWRWLLGCRSCHSVVIESPVPIAGHRIVGFAASVFVTPEFAESEIADPRPGMNARIIASVDAALPVALDETQLRYANTYIGLHNVIMCSAWRRHGLNPDHVVDIKTNFAASFLEIHAGYRLVQMLAEATDEVDIQHANSTGVHRIVSRFDEFHARNPANSWSRPRALVVVDRDRALSVTGSVAAFAFRYREPVLRLSDGDQRLLTAAMKGLTDEQLAQTLGLKLPTLKKRWASVFRRISVLKPELIPADDPDRNTRGPQKRPGLLAYLRGHPEELRPLAATKCDESC